MLFKFYRLNDETIEDAKEITGHSYKETAIKEYLDYLYTDCDGWEWMPKDGGDTKIRCIDETNNQTDFIFELEYVPTFYVREL